MQRQPVYISLCLLLCKQPDFSAQSTRGPRPSSYVVFTLRLSWVASGRTVPLSWRRRAIRQVTSGSPIFWLSAPVLHFLYDNSASSFWWSEMSSTFSYAYSRRAFLNANSRFHGSLWSRSPCSYRSGWWWNERFLAIWSHCGDALCPGYTKVISQVTSWYI